MFSFQVTYLFLSFYSTKEENTNKKRFSDNSLPQKQKPLEKGLDNIERAPEQNNNTTGLKNHSTETRDESGITSESKKVSEQRNAEKRQEIKHQKFKGFGKKKLNRRNKSGKRLTFKEMKELAVKKRLQRQFRGAKKKPLANLSAARLASYGLANKKKKKKS